MRDHASAITAIKAPQTGHLMLTTLHANDPINILEASGNGGQFQARMSPQLFISLLSQRLVQVILCPPAASHGMRWRARTDEERRTVENFCQPDAVYLRAITAYPHCWRGVNGGPSLQK